MRGILREGVCDPDRHMHVVRYGALQHCPAVHPAISSLDISLTLLIDSFQSDQLIDRSDKKQLSGFWTLAPRGPSTLLNRAEFSLHHFLGLITWSDGDRLETVNSFQGGLSTIHAFLNLLHLLEDLFLTSMFYDIRMKSPKYPPEYPESVPMWSPYGIVE